jgi:hypothetical protein
MFLQTGLLTASETAHAQIRNDMENFEKHDFLHQTKHFLWVIQKNSKVILEISIANHEIYQAQARG